MATIYIYDPKGRYYHFETTHKGGVVRAAISFKVLQFTFKAVCNPSSMRRACLLNDLQIQQIIKLKLCRGLLPVIESFDSELLEICGAEQPTRRLASVR